MLSVQLKSNKMNLPGSMVLVLFCIQLGTIYEKEKKKKKEEGRGEEGVAEVRGVRVLGAGRTS